MQSGIAAADHTVVDHAEPAAWNAWLAEREAASLWLRAEWEAVYQTYRLPCFRLAVSSNDQITGILPFVIQRSWLLGSQAVSLPWFDSAGLLTNDEKTKVQLLDRAQELAAKYRISVLQIRQNSKGAGLSPHVRTDKVLMRLKLEPEPDVLFKRIGSKVRNQIRKAQKSGLTVESAGIDRLPEFFDVYSTNMRDLGSPSHSLRFFEAVFKAFSHESRVYLVMHAGRCVGAGLTMDNGPVLEIPWASSLRDFNRFCVNHLMYWSILRDACEAGFDWFHFGRSTKGTGPYQFKSQWGAEEVQLFWYFLSSSTASAAAAAAAPPQSKFGWGSWAWRQIPTFVTRRIGPRLISQIP